MCRNDMNFSSSVVTLTPYFCGKVHISAPRPRGWPTAHPCRSGQTAAAPHGRPTTTGSPRSTRPSFVPSAGAADGVRATSAARSDCTLPGDEVVSFNSFPGRPPSRPPLYNQPPAVDIISLTSTLSLTLSSSPVIKASGQPRPRRGRRPARCGRARLPQRHDGLARARLPETVPGRRRQCSAGAPRPEAVNHQQLAG